MTIFGFGIWPFGVTSGKVSCSSAPGIIFKQGIQSDLRSSNQTKYLGLRSGFIEFSGLVSSKSRRHKSPSVGQCRVTGLPLPTAICDKLSIKQKHL